MWSRRASAARELLTLSAKAGPGEYNLGPFLRAHPELLAGLGAVDLETDDAGLALQLAPAVGNYKRHAARRQGEERRARSALAASELVARAVPRERGVEVEVHLLLGDLLADAEKNNIGFELEDAQVVVPRRLLLRARAVLRSFRDVVAFIDGDGVHLRWGAGRGGLNLRASPAPGATLLVGLRSSSSSSHPTRNDPVLLGEVLASLGFGCP